MLRPVGLTWTYDSECLVITTNEAVDDLPQVTRFYYVSDFARYVDDHGEGVPDYDAIIDDITVAVRPEAWDYLGGPGLSGRSTAAEPTPSSYRRRGRRSGQSRRCWPTCAACRGAPTKQDIQRLPPLPKPPLRKPPAAKAGKLDDTGGGLF